MMRSNRRNREVTEGQVYVKQGRGGGAWTVVAVRDDGLGQQHAQMQRMDEPNTYRTIAVQSLLDPKQFKLSSGAEGAS